MGWRNNNHDFHFLNLRKISIFKSRVFLFKKDYNKLLYLKIIFVFHILFYIIPLPYKSSQTPGYRPLEPIAQPPHILFYALVCDRTAFLVMGFDGKCGPGPLRSQCARVPWSVRSRRNHRWTPRSSHDRWLKWGASSLPYTTQFGKTHPTLIARS